MKPVRYPIDFEPRSALKKHYVEALAVLKCRDETKRLDWCQKKWRKVRKQLPNGSVFPSDIRKILKAEYCRLVSYYISYNQTAPELPDEIKGELESIFAYDAFHDAIAGFFMDSNNGFNLSVCHYCGISYINKYTVCGDSEGLETINNASPEELAKLLRIRTDSKIQLIIKHRPYTNVTQFNQLGVFRCGDKFHSVFPEKEDKNHFDLDHVLSQKSCPITAISMMNLVPSCSVCNEKLKKTKVLGQNGIPDLELSPTSPLYDFDGNVAFMLLPKAGKTITNRPTKHVDDYLLELKVKKSNYKNYIEIFHLKERYAFHIIEALFWLEQKYRYTDSRIAMMANALHDSVNFSMRRIKDDIFQRQFEQRERCFEKLKKDILE